MMFEDAVILLLGLGNTPCSVCDLRQVVIGGDHEVTGKGGHRRIYKPNFDESGFRNFIAEVTVKKLLDEFPEETKKIL